MRRSTLAGIAVTVLALLAGFLPLAAPASAADTPSTHTFVGADPKDPLNWTKPQNWDDSSVPAEFDIVIIRGSYAVHHVPDDKLFTSVTLAEGASLSLGSGEEPHGPLQTLSLVMDCGDLFGVDASVTGLATVTGGRLFDATLTVSAIGFGMAVRHPVPLLENGCSERPDQSGILLLQFSSRLQVDGILHGNGAVEGGTGVPELVQSSTGTIGSGSDELTLNNITASLSGKVAGTGVRIAGHGRVTTLVGRAPTAPPNSGFHLDAGAQLRLAASYPPSTGGTADYTATGVTDLGAGSRLVLGPGAILNGTPTYEGSGTLAMVNDTTPANQPPTIGGTVTTGTSTTLEVSGDGGKAVSASNSSTEAGAGRLVANGPTHLAGLGQVRVGVGSVDLTGSVEVPAGAANAPSFTGGGCCAEPVVPVTVRGTATIGAGASLTVSNMRLDLRGTVAGEGSLALVGGSHRFADAARVDAATTLRDRGVLTLPVGTVTLSAPLTLAESSTLTTTERVSETTCDLGVATARWCMATVTGDGSISWQEANVHGYVVTGPTVTVDLTADTAHRIDDRDSRVEVGGPATLNGTVPITAPATLQLGGRVSLAKVEISGTSCCTSPAVLRIDAGAVVTVPDGAFPRLSAMRVFNVGDVDLAGRHVYGDADWTVQPTGRVLLGGGRLDARQFRLADGLGTWGILVGPGTIGSDVANEGKIRFAKAGQLRVAGAYSQGSTGALEALIGPVRRSGRLWVAEVARLGGILDLERAGQVAAGLVLVQAGEVQRRFASVASPLPRGRRLDYGTSQVRILP